MTIVGSVTVPTVTGTSIDLSSTVSTETDTDYSSVTSTETDTSTQTSHTLETSTTVATTKTTTSKTTTFTTTTTTWKPFGKREAVGPSITTIIPTLIPGYATACTTPVSPASAYISACLCAGGTVTTITSQPVTTCTDTKYVTSTSYKPTYDVLTSTSTRATTTATTIVSTKTATTTLTIPTIQTDHTTLTQFTRATTTVTVTKTITSLKIKF